MTVSAPPGRHGRSLPPWPRRAGRCAPGSRPPSRPSSPTRRARSSPPRRPPPARRRSACTSLTGCSRRGGWRAWRSSRRPRTSAASGRRTRPATGSTLEPNRPNAAGPEPRDRQGVAVTYATVAAGAGVHRRRCAECATLLIADEPHHMGEQATWGRATVDAFAGARFRLLLSGTPFRSDNSPIPWVAYDDDGVRRADYGYGYTDALVDGVCRPVTFHTYDGDMEWVSDGRRAGRTSPSCWGRGRPRAGCARRSTPTATGSATCCATRTPPARPARRRRSRRRRPRRRDRQGARRAARRPARAGHRRAAGDRELRRARRLRADRPLRRGHGAVARVGADGLRGRRRAAAARRRLRDDRPHRAVLPPGGRALHPPHAGSQGPDEPRLPAIRPAAEAARHGDRGGAQPRARARARGRAGGRAGRAREAGEAFQALWSSARRDDDVLQTTQPGDALQLFAEPAPPACAGAGRVHDIAPRPLAPSSRRRRSSGASGCARSVTRSSPRSRAGRARRTATINARVNREVGAARSTSRPTSSWRRPTGCSSARSRRSVRWTRSRRGPSEPSRCSRPAAKSRTRSRCRRPSAAGRGRSAFALALRRESLARLRADPRCALTLLAAGTSRSP